MFGAQRTQTAAAVTQTGQAEIAFFPLFKVRYLLDGAIILIGGLRYVAGIATIRYYPADPHDNVPVDEAVVRFAQNVPCRWNDLCNGKR